MTSLPRCGPICARLRRLRSRARKQKAPIRVGALSLQCGGRLFLFLARCFLLATRDCVAEALAGAKCRDFARGDNELRAGLRVAALALLAIANDEAAERNQLHFVALDQRVADFVQEEIDKLTDLAFRELG